MYNLNNRSKTAEKKVERKHNYFFLWQQNETMLVKMLRQLDSTRDYEQSEFCYATTELPTT